MVNTISAPALPRGMAGGAALAGRMALRLLSPGGRRGLSVLIYHRVLRQADPLFPGEVTQDDFAVQLDLMRSCFNVLPLLEAVRRLRAGTLPPRAACISFDDGYADNAEVALPLLQHYGLPATFFVATGFLNGGRMWNDTVIELARRAPGGVLDGSALGLGAHPVQTPAQRRQAIGALIGQLKYVAMDERLALVNRLAAGVACALPDDLMMSDDQVRQLHRAGMGIGAHTAHHPILASLPAAAARAEIAGGRAALESIIGAPVPLFAYPNGKPGTDYGPEHVHMVREMGFEGAVSTAWGGSADGDPFQIPRFTPWDRTAGRFLLRLARNLLGRAARVQGA